MSLPMLLRSLLADTGFALRTYRRQPGFLLTALLTLAVGLGGCAVIYSVVQTLLLHPLSYPRADRLVLLRERNLVLGFPSMTSSPANFLDYRRETKVFQHLAAYRRTDLILLEGDEPERLTASPVAGELFAVLGVTPQLGTTFSATPGESGDGRVAVLGHELWQRRFGGEPSVVGRELHLDGEVYTVLGVMPAGFAFPPGAELWVPLDLGPEQWADRQGHYLSLIGRLAPGVSLTEAQSEMDLLSQRLAGVDPINEGWSSVLLSLEEQVAAPLRPAMLVLLAAGALLLAVACGNITNLLLARAAGRDRELATRAAFGAGRGRLLRQLLTESAVLTLGGGLVSLALAWLADRSLVRSTPALAPRWEDIGIDAQVALVTLALALVCGLAAGLAPALRLARGELRPRLSEGGRGTSIGWRRNRLITLLAALQLALSFVLLAGSGLLLHSFLRLARVDPGFTAENVLTLTLQLPEGSYPEGTARATFFSQALEQLRALPGVERAGAVSSLPLAGSDNFVRFRLPGRPADDRDYAPFVAVLPGYFETLEIPLLAGRTFAEADRTASPPVVILSDSLTRKYFPGEGPVGRRISLGDGENAPAQQIIGVVGDVRARQLEAEGGPTLYGLYDQAPFDTMSLCLRTSTEPASLVPAARRVIAAIDRRQPIGTVATLEEILRAATSDRRLALRVMGAFAVIALILAAVGIYGMLSHTVARGRREIGVRMALGAAPGSIHRLVVAYAAWAILPGLAVGGVAAYAASRLLASQLFGVGRSDAVTYLAVAAVLTILALAASWVPARRATRVDPARALGEE